MNHLDYLRDLLACTGVLAALYAANLYRKKILAGKIKCHRITWGGWALVGLLGLISSIRGGAGIGLLVAVVLELMILMFFGFSLTSKYGKPGGGKFEYAAGAFAALALLTQFWINYSPDTGQVISIVADLVFLSPTVIGAWFVPGEEDPEPWAYGALGEALGIAALGNWSFAAAGYSYYILAGNLAVIIALQLTPHRHAAHTASH